MRTYRTSTGQFSEWPFYKDDEVDRMCSDALSQNGLMPSEPGPVRIDRFVEKHFNIAVIYEAIGSGVLGFTSFGERGVASMHIDDPNDGNPVSERRVRSTLAHEAGHGLMHAHLFCAEFNRGNLFGGDADVSQEKVLCREPRTGYDGRWWELQANMAIGALLMPRDLLLRAMEPFVERQGMFQTPVLREARRGEAISAMSELFDVNLPVARIRIDGFFKVGAEKQLTL